MRLFSLDVALGAGACGSLVVYLIDGEMPLAWYFLLPLCVWLIYTLDHLLDGIKLKENAQNFRHAFHYKHHRTLLLIWVFLAFVGISSVFLFLPRNAILFGFGLGTLVLMHLGLSQLLGNKISPLLIKEGGVAIFYTAGIWGLPIVINPEGFDGLYILLIVQFSVMALINLLEFSLYEIKADELDQQTSFVRAIGIQRSRLFINLLCGISVALTIASLILIPVTKVMGIQFVFLLMTFVLILIRAFPEYFKVNERYRKWGDAVFLIPLIFLFL